MDIWKWVQDADEALAQSGQRRLRELLWRIPDDVCDDRHDMVDARVPEALALGARHPWIPIFVRHWQLQSRILHRLEVRDWIGEAVRLLDDANQPETRDCPQSICVTQDLVSCYGYLDGPGYAPERIAATDETLARIDARWPCFACISSERAGALLDAGRAEEAVAYLAAQSDARVAVGASLDGLVFTRASALLACDRPAEALAILDTHSEGDAEHNRHQRDLLKARAFVALDRAEEAGSTLPKFAVVRPTPSLWQDWVRAYTAMVKRGWSANDANVERLLGYCQTALSRRGVIRQAVDTAILRAELAITRERRWTAEWALDEAQALLPELRAPFDLPARIAALRAEAAALPLSPDPASPEEVLGGAGVDPERDLEQAVRGRGRWPEHPGLAQLHARALAALERTDEGLQVLRRYVAAHPEEADARVALAHLLTAAGRAEEGRETLTPLLSADPPSRDALAVLSGIARASGDPAEEERLLSLLHALDPADEAALLRRADLRVEAGRAAEAVADLDLLLTGAPEDHALHWRRVVAATIAEDWARVRASAATLGMEIEGEGPIDERWGLCRLQWTQDAPGHALVALRTGPVTARVLEIAGPQHKERRGEEVVFDPKPVQAATSESELHTFSVLVTKRAGAAWSGLLDLAHPGAEGAAALRKLVEGFGAGFEVWREDGYTVRGPYGAPTPGLLAAYAVPAGADEVALDRALRDFAAARGLAMTWPELVKRVGDPERVAAQAALATLHDLWWPAA